MPIAGFKNFSACISAQVKKGKSRDSARRICGKIEANTRKARRNK